VTLNYVGNNNISKLVILLHNIYSY